MFRGLLERLQRYEDSDEREAVGGDGPAHGWRGLAVADGRVADGPALKGERPAEIVGFARAMRERAVRAAPGRRGVRYVRHRGDGAHTFNVSTAAAIVLAGAGVTVAKHGNRAVLEPCGRAPMCSRRSASISKRRPSGRGALERANLAFFFAPMWHPSMRHAGPTRRELGLRTAFNLLGPLTNPAAPTRSSSRVAARAHRARGALAGRAGREARLGRARRRQSR
jgi:anthranilate phosphoribosyltransferase